MFHMKEKKEILFSLLWFQLFDFMKIMLYRLDCFLSSFLVWNLVSFRFIKIDNLKCKVVFWVMLAQSNVDHVRIWIGIESKYWEWLVHQKKWWNKDTINKHCGYILKLLHIGVGCYLKINIQYSLLIKVHTITIQKSLLHGRLLF